MERFDQRPEFVQPFNACDSFEKLWTARNVCILQLRGGRVGMKQAKQGMIVSGRQVDFDVFRPLEQRWHGFDRFASTPG